MGKKRRSFTLDPEVYRLLQQDETTNASALVNKILKQYYDTGRSADRVILEQRLDRIEEEIGKKRDELEELREERERIEQQLDKRRTKTEKVVEQAEPVLADKEDPENPAVRNWANKAGMEPEELLKEVKNGDRPG